MKTAFLTGFILLFHTVIAQSNIYPDLKIKFEHLSIKDGLSNNNTYSILQDHNGFIWIGSYAGLDRYDGYSFKNYS